MNSHPEPVVHVQIREDAVAVVRIERPEVKNALNSAVREQLADSFRLLSRSEEHTSELQSQ